MRSPFRFVQQRIYPFKRPKIDIRAQPARSNMELSALPRTAITQQTFMKHAAKSSVTVPVRPLPKATPPAFSRHVFAKRMKEILTAYGFSGRRLGRTAAHMPCACRTTKTISSVGDATKNDRHSRFNRSCRGGG